MKPLTRLIDDDRFSADLRAELRGARETPPVDYDDRAGLARLSAALVAVPAVGVAAAATTKAAAAGAAASTGVVAVSATKIGAGLKLALGLFAATSIVSGTVYFASSYSNDRPVPPVMRTAEPVALGPRPEPEALPPPPVAEVTAPAPEKSAPSATPVAPASADPKATMKAELAHQAELRSALADPARALQLANEGQAKFPRGVFGQEREVIAIQALQRLGRADEAKRRSDAFIAAHPESMYADSLRQPAP